ncbi:MAG: hypothetical protein RR290_00605 [Clostridia bacterium]
MLEAGFSFECCQCGHSEHELGSEYCEYCGLKLSNYCSNAKCVKNYGADEPMQLSQDARYCNICGEKSTHYEHLIENAL